MADQNFNVRAEHYQYHFSVARGMLQMSSHTVDNSGEVWSDGRFLDPRGAVSVYRERDYTGLTFVHDGKAFVRSWRKCWGDRTICRLARAFITDLQENPHGY